MRSSNAPAVALNLIAWVLRIAGIVLCVLTVLLCFSGVAAKLNIVGFIVELSRMLPDVIAGYGLMPTPFGGVFRLDYALVALLCFGGDYLLGRASRKMRR